LGACDPQRKRLRKSQNTYVAKYAWRRFHKNVHHPLYNLVVSNLCVAIYYRHERNDISCGSSLLNAYFMYMALKLKFAPKADTAMATFKFSILHLMVLFVVLLVDHYVVI
jgi:heme O synthase-like polyprenyltransferase